MSVVHWEMMSLDLFGIGIVWASSAPTKPGKDGMGWYGRHIFGTNSYIIYTRAESRVLRFFFVTFWGGLVGIRLHGKAKQSKAKRTMLAERVEFATF